MWGHQTFHWTRWMGFGIRKGQIGAVVLEHNSAIEIMSVDTDTFPYFI